MKTLRIFTVLAALALLSACSKSPVEQLRGELLSGCIDGGGLKDICKCAVDRSIKKASPALLKAMEAPNPPEDMKTKISDLFYQQAGICKHKFYPDLP